MHRAVERFEIASLHALAHHGYDAVIDVRSPAEFAEDHVPGAVNLPALDDAQRAEVGTVYTRDSPFRARKIGAAMVARNVAGHVEGPLAAQDGAWRPLVYCWRGGQRSGSVATILAQIGWRTAVVAGGYRSYRAAVRRVLYDDAFPAPIVLLDGLTGTAKTALLNRAAARGVPILDLEGLAHHRGSVFGHRDGDQPSQKAFESALAAQVAALAPGRPVLVEAESSKVGARALPPGLWAAMRTAPRIEIAAPPAARAAYLRGAYADIAADPEQLHRMLAALVRLQGGERVARWQAMARAGAFTDLAADLMAQHYDPRYARQRARDVRPLLARIEMATLAASDLDGIADRIADRIGAMAAAPVGPA